MHKFVIALITEWRRIDLPFDGETVIIAVSGGADSVSLLLAMHDLRERQKLKLRLVAAHFNHKLRGDESDEDEEFVRGLTSTLGVELAVGRGNISTEGNLEQNARQVRYEFLNKTAQSVDAFAVITGHTVNDQAETFLMNLIRGSGPDGLSGMKAVRPLGILEWSDEADDQGSDKSVSANKKSVGTILVRPMLTWAKRINTEAFCHDLGVEYRYDTMNEDTAFKRVRIRKILLPLLEDMNPNIIETLANTASLMQGLTAENNLPRPSPDVLADLKISGLRPMATAERCNTIRDWLCECRGNKRQLRLKHIQAIERLAFSTKSGRTAELPGGKVTKTAGRLVYKENKVEN